MELSLHYSALRIRFREWLGHHESLLEFFRLCRYAVIQGPWQDRVIHRLQDGARPRPMVTYSDTLFPFLDIGDAVDRLGRDSYAPGFIVPPGMVDEIVTFARGETAKRIDDSHLRCTAVRRIARDPRIVALARAYLGAEPILFNSRLYWTLPKPDEFGRIAAPAEGGRFHYDVADVKALTLFVYLTDVDEDSGPHVVVRGTHGRRNFFQVFRRFLDDEYAEARFGERIHTITGKRGSAWFEDITCFHKQAGGTKPRLMLTLIYSLQRRAEEEVRWRDLAEESVAV